MLSRKDKVAIIKELIKPLEIDQDYDKTYFADLFTQNAARFYAFGQDGSRKNNIQSLYHYLTHTYPFSMACAQIKLKLGNYRDFTSDKLSNKMTQEINRFDDDEIGSIPLLHFIAKQPKLAELAFNNEAFIDYYFGDYEYPETNSGPNLIADICLNQQIWWHPERVKRSSDKDVNKKLSAFVKSPLFKQVMFTYYQLGDDFSSLTEAFSKVGIQFDVDKTISHPDLARRSLIMKASSNSLLKWHSHSNFFHTRHHTHQRFDRDEARSFMSKHSLNGSDNDKNKSRDIHALYWLRM